MAGRKQSAQIVQLPAILRGTDRIQWRLDVDPAGNLLFQKVGSTGDWETKKTLTPTGAWI